MGFKRNVTITLACVITELLISLIPSIFMIFFFFFMDEINEIFYSFLLFLFFILVINVILIIITFVVQIFMKTKYYVNDECLVIKTKNESREIKYSEIGGITYDYGNLGKFNHHSSQLVLFNKDYKQLLSINNPSIFMVHLIIKKCKHIKVCYYNNKRLLFLSLLLNSVTLFICILIKLFVK